MSLEDLHTALLAEADKDEEAKLTRRQAKEREHQRIFQEQADEKARELQSRVRVQRQIQEDADEREMWDKVGKELQAVFVKAEAEDKASFMETYSLLYDLSQKASETKTKKQFTKIAEVFGFPYTDFSYSEQEKTGLPLMLMDREGMNMALRMGLWPWRKNPLEEMIESMKTVNEPQETAPVYQALLLDIIEKNPFAFVNLGEGK